LQINYAVVSSDDSYYADFWPIVAKGWKRIGITPVFFKIGPTWGFYEDAHGLVYEVPAIEGVKTSWQAQVIRIWAYKVLTGNIILSDMDMLAISSDYFNKNAEPHEEDKIVIYGADAYQDNEYPMCYILANDKVMKGIIKQETWGEFAAYLLQNCGQGWGTDQWFMTKSCKEYGNLVKLNRGWNSGGVANKRLDRIGWDYRCENAKDFIDCHLLRPYNENKEKIDNLISCIENG
jgi:hypothetical protein